MQNNCIDQNINKIVHFLKKLPGEVKSKMDANHCGGPAPQKMEEKD